MRLQSLVLGIVITCVASALGSELDKAQFEGQIFIKGQGTVPYLLIISYEPTGPEPASFRRLKSVELSVNSKRLGFPKQALEGLEQVHRPWPLYGVGGEPGHVQFRLEGGDASKSYRVTFKFDSERLVERRLLKHLEEKPVVTRYPANEMKTEGAP